MLEFYYFWYYIFTR